MRKFLCLFALFMALALNAQHVSVNWPLSSQETLGDASITGDSPFSSYISTGFELGSKIDHIDFLTKSGASTGFEAAPYDPPFAALYVATKQTARAAGNNIAVKITPAAGHKFKPTKVSFDACKVGTDGGSIDVTYKGADGVENLLEGAILPQRNRTDASNSTGYSHHDIIVNDMMVENGSYTILIYVYNINGVDNSSPKAIALRNVTIEGDVDDEIHTGEYYVKSFTFKDDKGATIDLTSRLDGLKNGDSFAYPERLSSEPSGFNVVCAEGFTPQLTFDGKNLSIVVLRGETEVFGFDVRFTVKTSFDKPEPKPLGRGLMSVSLTGANMGTGNLISWRHREADGYGVKYKLIKGTAETQNTALARGMYIIDKTNFLDSNGTPETYYRLEVYNSRGQLLETEICGTWANQTLQIPIEAPVDTRNGALYNPNDASFCDMDGDGEYEIILKWSPSNEKDAASSGTTSSPFFDCIKLDGTRLWRIELGNNFFTSAHTIQFIAWDFDGDGYGEFMCKTGPGTIDGQGNYVLLGDDDPTANWLNSRGKQVEGPEYITVFDGMTGAELATIPYHTNYQAGANYWGDSNQNRSERYLAALAYLDGPDANPSPIFARGYYSGAFVCAYDWDGTELKERWVSRNTTSGQGLWGEGAHWISVGDCNGDGRQDIIYGSAALKHDGTLLYRTGLGHGDALHLGDFLTDRPGLEVFMVHEKSPYGFDFRDAATGELLWHKTESGDTGRGLAAHFDSTQPSAQCMYSASGSLFNLDDHSVNGETWAIGSSGAGINNRIYWDGDLYDEFFDKSIIAHWNPENKWFDRIKVNNTFYTSGTLNNATKYNPCVLGDILGDWREEIITHDGSFEKNSGVVTASATHLIINATSYPSDYRIPHLMDDPQYRVQVVNQNCCYNQPPHLSFDPAVKYAGNPNVAVQKNETSISDISSDLPEAIKGIYTIQGVKIDRIDAPGFYIVDGMKVFVK